MRCASLVVAVVLAALGACRGRQAAPAPRGQDAPDAIAAPAPADAAAPDGAAALDAPAAASLAQVLAAEAAGPVVLVEDAGGLVARARTGAAIRTLVAGAVAHAQRQGDVVWFVRGGRLEALDLAAPPGAPIAIVLDMPDLGFEIDGSLCDACVMVSTVPPGLEVVTEQGASGGELTGPALRRFERDRAIALAARPRLAPTAAAFFATLRGRPRAATPELALSDRTWSVPPAPRGKVDCPDCHGQKDVECPECGRGFVLDALGWVLVVADRQCSCAEDRCWATCVLLDPDRGRYAAPSAPASWGATAPAERACSPVLDRAGTAYLAEGRVCTAAGCAALAGRILGWLDPGPTTAPLAADSGAWPRCHAP